ncbi:MAG TPA: S41 family peptidase [Woeseiaceae bacterium]|nr:S41 family peptidase [Woeseiaceae bacterium]
MSLKIRGILVMVVGVTLGFSLSLGGGVLADRKDGADDDLPWEQARLLAEVMERVKRDYVDDVDDRRLMEAAIRGMVADLDPHSRFLDEEQYEEIRISTTGNYSGVGIEVSMDDGEVRVVAPFDGTPAQQAGILPGDLIVAIDDQPVDHENLDETVGRMRGQVGTRVKLTVMRGRESLDFSLLRANVHVESVRAHLLGGDLGYVRLTQFSESTSHDLKRALRGLERRHGDDLAGLVLDLRNNPGGVLDAAVDVADLFLEEGLIVSAEGRSEEARFSHSARRGDVLDGAQIVVLVNSGSASASEIVAGALRDNDRATIVGTPTFGKGSVQTVMPLSNGHAIKLTTSRYFTPSGASIHETGIEPDVVIEQPAEAPLVSAILAPPDTAADRQLAVAIDRITRPRILQSKAP